MRSATISPRWTCAKCQRRYCGAAPCPFCYRITPDTMTLRPNHLQLFAWPLSASYTGIPDLTPPDLTSPTVLPSRDGLLLSVAWKRTITMYAKSFLALDGNQRLTGSSTAQISPDDHYTCHICDSARVFHLYGPLAIRGLNIPVWT